MRLLVDLDRLPGAEGALLAMARAAGEMTSFGDERSDVPVAVGTETVQEAVEHFVRSWSYGMDLVSRDADRLHSLLHTIGAGATGARTTSERGAEPATEPEVREAFQVTLTEDADRVEILATWLADCAGQAATATSGLTTVDLEAWTGEGAEAFSDAVGMLSARLEKGARAFRDAASTLRACAAVLWEAQLRARQAGLTPASLYAGATAGGGSASPEGDQGAETGGVEAGGSETLEECRAAAEDGIRRAAVRLRQAADLAPRGPHSPPPDPHATPSGVGAGLGGVWESVWGLGVFAFEVKPVHDLIEVSSYVETFKGLADELLRRGPHPVSFPTSTSTWSTWLTHRTRAFGQLLPPRAEPPGPAEDAEEIEPVGTEPTTTAGEVASPDFAEPDVIADVHEPEIAEPPARTDARGVDPSQAASTDEEGQPPEPGGGESDVAGISEPERAGTIETEPSEVEPAPDSQALATPAPEGPQALPAEDKDGATQEGRAGDTAAPGPDPAWDFHGVEALRPDALESVPDAAIAAEPGVIAPAAIDLSADATEASSPDTLEQTPERPPGEELEPAGEQLRSGLEEPEPEASELETPGDVSDGQSPAVEAPAPVASEAATEDAGAPEVWTPSQAESELDEPETSAIEAEARGAASGRPFHPGRAGGPTRRLRASGVRITPRGVAVVERHVSRFGPDEVDAAMVGRLRRIADGELGATPTDRNFCVHQLRAFVRYRRLGHPSGDPGYEVWNDAHTAALEDYGMHEGPHVLYPVGDTTTDYELAVLRAIGSGQAPVRWYKIEQRLSVMPIQTRGSLPEALGTLGSRGLVQRGAGPEDAHELTPAGRRYLADQDR